ncbi:DUF1853 family protein [Ferrimonas lipolytica]|uniref:DUF1853 family protein n=1 Tax=Ferrimonas lipolytica TaxID=2724191 RepID=A0A6H1UBT3_9GAMM|nr:DUF1853 family protein [Ferrimonas lipolytica]QIZ76521.1 DUF1853 family protein [Ferrimonas lipolytica]
MPINSMQLTHPLARDLTWVLTAPPLYQQGPFIDSNFIEQFAAPLWPQLNTIAANPCPQFKLGHRRLGSYYEQLWYTLLRWHPDYQLLATDKVIWQGQRTKGALDIVVKHLPSATIEHWELAIKFYLGVDDGLDPYQWLGPGKHDCLGNKLEHLLTKQLPLSKTTEAKTQLQQLGWRVDTQRIVMQGRIYLPQQQFPLPPRLNPAALQGRWYRVNQLPQRNWRVLTKPDWLAGRRWQVLPRFVADSSMDWPRHIYCPDANQHAFVVPNNW